jgi:Domain of unknown function (DUF3303)
MKSLLMGTYRYREGLAEADLRQLVKEFLEFGVAPGVIAHYERLDGSGGFVIQELPEDPEKAFEVTLRYRPWIDFEVIPVTTLEDAFPIIQRVYG